ncbi:hypothetical protein [Clostridium sp.]|uniref:hypothetical protein n=1 Tax=Clostridium sp. TaxID=1506 RepID=UPI00260EE32D|nr:hypothetical protein [Clostridium sp.]
MIEFSYLCLLLFTLIFLLLLVRKNNNLSPKKIKMFLNIVLTSLIIRYISLIINFIVEEQRISYLFKYLYNLNYLSIPLISIVIIYIFLRNEKLKFKYLNIVLITFIALYLTIIKFYKHSILIDIKFGFIIALENSNLVTLVYLVIMASLLVFCLINLDKTFSNKIGMRCILGTLLLYIIEFILGLSGLYIYPFSIIGEILIYLNLLKSINTFK